MFLAIAIALLGVWDFIPAYGIELYPFGYIPVVICLSIIAYAIVKHRLMDISVTITRTGIFVAVYTLVLGLPFVLAVFGKAWLLKFLGEKWWLGPLFLGTALATLGPFVYIYFQKRAEAILLREQHRYQETLKQVGMEMTRIHNLNKLLNFIVEIIAKNVRISHSVIYLSEANNGKLLLKTGHNLKKEQPASIDKKNTLIKCLENQKEILIYEEVKRKFEENPDSIFKSLEEQMRQLNATVIVPHFLEDRLIGVLILGDKQSGRIYTSEDLDVFSVLATQSALAIENASLYNNIEEQVRQRTAQLVDVQKQLVQAEKLATMGTLAGGVAHEINNPLTAILTNVQMLLSEGDSPGPDTKESLQLIEEATQRCRTIVQKLMAYAKQPLEAAGASEVNMANAVKNVVSLLRYQFEQDNIKITTDIKENNCLVRGNQNELEQVVTNLCLNAKDAIRKIKKSGTINISVSGEDGWVKIVIQDDGCGIPKEIIPKVFDPFFTTKDVGKGLGLGLSICQAIVEKHKGTITVQSELNKGSVFTIKIPKADIKNATI